MDGVGLRSLSRSLAWPLGASKIRNTKSEIHQGIPGGTNSNDQKPKLKNKLQHPTVATVTTALVQNQASKIGS